MTDAEHEKALLLAKIEAHRALFALEPRLARMNLDPLRWAASIVAAILPLIAGRTGDGPPDAVVDPAPG